ncbi:hypothetical protein LCGC14_0760220 [marine sediment metagenome]|uniref:50S ribosomal protein L20 n=1 Tax=marine sediment metagenome TaxID=412755 RepID=A0A0F9Q5J6_9ZZZZ|nr:50S ribosomal protein L20 [Actinomycetota bacterium]
MPRVKSTGQNKKHKKIMKSAKGYYGARSRTFKAAKEQVTKSLNYAYRDRRVKKRTFRRLWIIRINAAARKNDISYNQFVNGLKEANIDINRKALADMAVNDPSGFAELAKIAKEKVTVAK